MTLDKKTHQTNKKNIIDIDVTAYRAFGTIPILMLMAGLVIFSLIVVSLYEYF